MEEYFFDVRGQKEDGRVFLAYSNSQSCFQDITFVTADGESVRLIHLAKDRNVNVLFSAKFSEVPVFTGIFRFQQNVRFSRFNF